MSVYNTRSQFVNKIMMSEICDKFKCEHLQKRTRTAASKCVLCDFGVETISTRLFMWLSDDKRDRGAMRKCVYKDYVEKIEKLSNV